jgi:LPXTG-site transpeptidase (sortase) family protein
LPATGFAPNRVTALPVQPADKAYSSMGSLWLEVPKLNLQMDIVGVAETNGSWDVSWLGNNAGWLNGTAFPAHSGNSVITGHVWNADNTPGPFVAVNQLWWGDKVIIHDGSTQYIFEVRSLLQVSPANTAAMLVHEDQPWITLVTCRGFNSATGTYQYRVLVRAALVDVK